MNYNPKDAANLWPEGDYSGVLENVEETTSKKKPDGSGGNPMEVWTFKAYDDVNNRTKLLTVYVVAGGGTFRIKQLAIAIGKKSEFDAGTFQAADNIKANVTLALAQEEGTGSYEDKMVVAKIKPKTGNTPSRPPAPVTAGSPIGSESVFKDDDVPF